MRTGVKLGEDKGGKVKALYPALQPASEAPLDLKMMEDGEGM